MGVDLYRLKYLAEIFLITFGMPILTFKVYGLTKFEIDIFNVLIAQRALFHGCIHLLYKWGLKYALCTHTCEAYTTDCFVSQEKK